ncbi:hypothetical protein L484_003594 [Morus notabilis]|uniref:Uncharacterized protein n=1 Tax=Morus notabilis TaxID=981085 RepID=W9S6F6_9ROSA|nr:hypothetical protein L484_003594 [Morus notabilis]
MAMVTFDKRQAARSGRSGRLAAEEGEATSSALRRQEKQMPSEAEGWWLFRCGSEGGGRLPGQGRLVGTTIELRLMWTCHRRAPAHASEAIICYAYGGLPRVPLEAPSLDVKTTDA